MKVAPLDVGRRDDRGRIALDARCPAGQEAPGSSAVGDRIYLAREDRKSAALPSPPERAAWPGTFRDRKG